MEPFVLLSDSTIWCFPSYFQTFEMEEFNSILPITKMDKLEPFQVTFFGTKGITIQKIFYYNYGAVFVTPEFQLYSMDFDKYLKSFNCCTEEVFEVLKKPNDTFFKDIVIINIFENTWNSYFHITTDDHKVLRVSDDTPAPVPIIELENKIIISFKYSEAAEVFLCTDGLWYRPTSDAYFLLADNSGTGNFVRSNFFEENIPKQVAIGNYFIYVLCDDGLYSYGGTSEKLTLYDPNKEEEENEEEENEEEDEGDDRSPEDKVFKKVTFFEGKEIIKISCSQFMVICWCKQGIFIWTYLGKHIDDHIDSFYYGLGDEEDSSVEDAEVVHLQFFNKKKILDIYAMTTEFFWVLCEDGLYYWGDDDLEAKNGPPFKLTLWKGKAYPSFFTFQTTVARMNLKRARPNELIEEEQTTKEQKV